MKFFIIYFAIGIFLAFAFVMFNKIVEHLKDSKIKRCLKHICLNPNDESGFVLGCIVLVLLWPLVLAMVAIGGGMALVFSIVAGIGIAIYNAAIWLVDKMFYED